MKHVDETPTTSPFNWVTQRKHIPGEVGVWIFIGGDCLIFSIFFLTFMHYRGLDPELFNKSQGYLNQSYGLSNTALMLTSSWFVAMAVSAARQLLTQYNKSKNDTSKVLRLMQGAQFCGIAFIALKYLEYSEKISTGISPVTNDFFTLYFMFTGIHLLHVVLGIGVITFLQFHMKNKLITESQLMHLESGASFWHLVDLLWIVLFAILYVLR